MMLPVGSRVLDGSEVEFLECGFDLGAVADGDNDEVIGVDVVLGGAATSAAVTAVYFGRGGWRSS